MEATMTSPRAVMDPGPVLEPTDTPFRAPTPGLPPMPPPEPIEEPPLPPDDAPGVSDPPNTPIPSPVTI